MNAAGTVSVFMPALWIGLSIAAPAAALSLLMLAGFALWQWAGLAASLSGCCR